MFSCGWQITLDGQDAIRGGSRRSSTSAGGSHGFDFDDQVEACRRVLAGDTRWTVVRRSSLEEGESEGLPVWSRHVGDPVFESNITRRVDFALFVWPPSRMASLFTQPRQSSAARVPRR